MDLKLLGWSSVCPSSGVDIDYVARVIAVHRSGLKAISKNGPLNLYMSGSLEDTPAVGDWVEFTPPFIDEQNKPAALVRRVFSRKTKISRTAVGSQSAEQIIAANVDLVFIVCSANQDFNINRIKRYVLLAIEGGAVPVLVLSKMDLVDEEKELLADVSSGINTDIDIIQTSAMDQASIDQLRSRIPTGVTSVFVGSSGVGKSTLVNLLLAKKAQKTAGIREDDGKGRHTTTSRELFFIPGGGMIIDTPGLREVGVFGSQESIDSTYEGIAELVSQCKFADCKHETEPGCAIQAALSGGRLSEKDWGNYQKLLREMQHANRKMNKAEAANSKKKWRRVHLNMRQRRKFEGKD